MSSKRNVRKKSCSNKEKYETSNSAWREIRYIYDNDKKRDGRLHPYKCIFCKKYHIGHYFWERYVG